MNGVRTHPAQAQTSHQARGNPISAAFMFDLLLNGAKEIPLKKAWTLDLGDRIGMLTQGSGGRLYAVLPDSVKAIGADGKIAASFPVSGARAAGEANGRVYIQSEQLRKGAMYIANRVDESLHVFTPDGKLIWRHDFPQEKQDSMGGDGTPPIEDAAGNVWVKCNSKMHRLSHDGSETKVVDDHIWPHPMIPAPDGSVYTYWGTRFRYAPDLTLSTIDGHPNEFFLIGNQSYSCELSDHALYKNDFDKGKDREILHWDDGRNSMKPFVRGGTIHLVLRAFGDGPKKSLYITADKDGNVTSRKDIDVKLHYKCEPVVTPGGTLYVFGEQRSDKEGNFIPLYAIDKDNLVHTARLPDLPMKMFCGKGEQVIAAMKDGALQAFEAPSAAEMRRDKMEEAGDRLTMSNLRDAWGGNPIFT